MYFQYLFFKESDRIESYFYRDGSFELLQHNGNNFYSNDLNSFFDWWSSVSSFDDGDFVDFVLISDSMENSFFDALKFKTIQKTEWSLDKILQFLAKSCENYLTLNQNGNSIFYKKTENKNSKNYLEKVDFNKNREFLKYISLKTYFLSFNPYFEIIFPEKEIDEPTESVNKISNSPIVEYFIKKTIEVES